MYACSVRLEPKKSTWSTELLETGGRAGKVCSLIEARLTSQIPEDGTRVREAKEEQICIQEFGERNDG